MTRSRDPFGNALAALRAQLRNGRFTAGSPLVAAELAPSLAVSITPVREVLAHLAGEGLIEERRGRGYFAHRLEVGELEALYRLHWVYIDAALKDPGSPGAPPRPAFSSIPPKDEIGPSQLRTATEHLFAVIVRGDDNRLLAKAHQHVVDRLAAPRLHEGAVFNDLESELNVLAHAYSIGDVELVRSTASAYHARRLAHAKALAAQVVEPSSHYYPNII